MLHGWDRREANGFRRSAPLEEEIKLKISLAKQGGGYIYHSDHSIPKNVSFANYKRVIGLVKKYGAYA